MNLTQLNLKGLTQVEEIIIKNCPKLISIECNQKQEQKPIIIQPESLKETSQKKETDWLCIIGVSSGLTAIFWHIYTYWRDKRKKRKKP